jgi:basic membrane protein A and related proteins
VRATITAVAALGAAALLAACGSGASAPRAARAPRPAPRPAITGKLLACLVTDTAGLNDHSLNASAWQGLQAAAAVDPGITIRAQQPASAGDYTPDISRAVAQQCGMIVTVSFLMGDNTEAAARADPAGKFAIVDYDYKPAIPNIDALVFSTVQDGFLGGYLAAGMSTSHVVATFGGQRLPTVTDYMDGFWDGVQYYNAQHQARVKVLGWSEPAQQGSFTGDFTTQAAGQTLTRTFISEGADVIFPVAGPVSLGAARAVQAADQAAGGTRVSLLWMDTDGCVNAPQFCPYMLSTVTKGVQASVEAAVLSAAAGTFAGGTHVGDLANDGVALAPYHDFAARVPARLQAELSTIRQEIISGQIRPATPSPA